MSKKITRAEMKDLCITEKDLRGGIELEEYDALIEWIKGLKEAEKLKTNDAHQKAVSETIFNIMKAPEYALHSDLGYHRRKGFIEANEKTEIID